MRYTRLYACVIRVASFDRLQIHAFMLRCKCIAAYTSSSASSSAFSRHAPSDCADTSEAAVSIAAAVETASAGIMKSTQLPVLLQFCLEV